MYFSDLHFGSMPHNVLLLQLVWDLITLFSICQKIAEHQLH
jgi:hypothetical protein